MESGSNWRHLQESPWVVKGKNREGFQHLMYTHRKTSQRKAGCDIRGAPVFDPDKISIFIGLRLVTRPGRVSSSILRSTDLPTYDSLSPFNRSYGLPVLPCQETSTRYRVTRLGTPVFTGPSDEIKKGWKDEVDVREVRDLPRVILTGSPER